MAVQDYFNARATFDTGSGEAVLYRLDALEKRAWPTSTGCPIRSKCCWKPRCARPTASRSPRRRWRPSPTGARRRPARSRFPSSRRVSCLQDFTGVPSVVDLAALRSAMAAHGRRSQEGQPAGAGRSGHRPLRAGRPLRQPLRPLLQRRARVRAQPRALRVPQVGPAGLRQLPRGAAGHRHRAPGQPGVPGQGRATAAGERQRHGT